MISGVFLYDLGLTEYDVGDLIEEYAGGPPHRDVGSICGLVVEGSGDDKYG